MSADNKVMTRNSAKSGKPETPEPASLQSIDDKLNSINILSKHDIKKEQKDLAASIELCRTNISDVKQLVTKQDSKITACEDELVRVNEENQRLWKELRSTKQELRDLEQCSHRNNLIIYGIPEDKNENIQHVMRRLAVTLQFENWSSSLMDAVHRMGKATQTQPRPIIVKFVSRLDKDDFWNKRKVRPIESIEYSTRIIKM
ncbi:hypothetical protein J6590_077193 [Homalodisca vitripennis]|nr:hypothetical protein J6590_077193 [Homalodisca vitripennis]